MKSSQIWEMDWNLNTQPHDFQNCICCTFRKSLWMKKLLLKKKQTFHTFPLYAKLPLHMLIGMTCACLIHCKKQPSSSTPWIHTFSICYCNALPLWTRKCTLPFDTQSLVWCMLRLFTGLLLCLGCAYSCTSDTGLPRAPAHLGKMKENTWSRAESPRCYSWQPSNPRHLSEHSQGQPSSLANHQQTKHVWAINSVLCVTEVLGLFLTQHYCRSQLKHIKLIGV